MKTVPVTDCDGWTHKYTRTCLLFEGTLPPVEAVPLIGPAGKTWEPGTKFIFLGGNKSSAGFEWLEFTGVPPVEYLGQIDNGMNDGGKIALFQQADFFHKFGWHVAGETLQWGTDKHAGRIVELDRATVEGQPIPPHPKGKGKRGAGQVWPVWVECRDCWHLRRFTILPQGLSCWECESENLTVWSSRSRAQRPVFDEFEARNPDANRTVPPPAVEV